MKIDVEEMSLEECFEVIEMLGKKWPSTSEKLINRIKELFNQAKNED